MLAQGRLASLILWGPPGTGKTTIARLLAKRADLEFQQLSAIFSGVADLQKAFEKAEGRRAAGKGTLLFVDEIHRFNRAQQDGFLPFVERGVVTLVGATTENPSFELNGALLSRTQVYGAEAAGRCGAGQAARRAPRSCSGKPAPLTEDGKAALMAMADGDGRYLLTLVEELFAWNRTKPLDANGLMAALQKRAPAYDKDREEHYNLISAWHKSIRGSDPDAALYWLARMLEGGEDPLFLARRMIRAAVEDIGVADPTALMICNEAADAYDFLGSPEGELALAQAVVHLATAPKSNAVYVAYKAAKRRGARDRLADAAGAHPQRADEADEGARLRQGLPVRPRRRGPSPARTTSPTTWSGRPSTSPRARAAKAPIREKLEQWAKLRRERSGD